MKVVAIIVGLMLPIGVAHGQPAQKSDVDCGAAEPGDYMNLPVKEFDQSLDKGWRRIGDKQGCERAAADLIAKYRADVLAQDAAGLDWHEAQLRAAAGGVASAIALFKRNLDFKRTLPDDPAHRADVIYAEATIAYLERDLPRLRARRADLAAVPKPDWFDDVAANYLKRNPGATVSMMWPTNLNVVDGFIACFDRPYGEAYSFACQPKQRE